MRRVFKTRYFSRWMRKTELTDAVLCMAVSEMERGLIDADLGGGVYKKRVPLPGRGKRGGARTLVATNRGDRWFFIDGYEKSERENISSLELESVRQVAAELLEVPIDQLDVRVASGSLEEICR